MNLISRILSGTILVIGGLLLVVFASKESFVFTIYGIIIVVVGGFILFNKNEDKVEPRKDLKVKGGKK